SPALYTWDFGDGSPPLTTTDPGRAWPDHTVSHIYRAPTTARISLRTEWDAVFRVEGTDVWVPVTGRAVTTATTDPIDVVTAPPRLTAGWGDPAEPRRRSRQMPQRQSATRSPARAVPCA